MNIYFSGSIRGGGNDTQFYLRIIDVLKQYGHVFAEHIYEHATSGKGTVHLTDTQIHDRDIEWIDKSDIVVAEVSTPSLGVGYEIRYALEKNIPVLVLHRHRVSAMITGAPLQAFLYESLQDVQDILSKYMLAYKNNIKN
ncbi:MAG: nucleoside 2-deoxyribosyltransferase [Candidatus Woesearchaeota archaeon]